MGMLDDKENEDTNLPYTFDPKEILKDVPPLDQEPLMCEVNKIVVRELREQELLVAQFIKKNPHVPIERIESAAVRRWCIHYVCERRAVADNWKQPRR